MKKIYFNKQSCQFSRPALTAQSVIFPPLPFPRFTLTVFERFPGQNQMIFAVKTSKKSCRIKPIPSFLLSGTHYAGLLRANQSSLAKKTAVFPQTGHCSDSDNYIKSYQSTDQTHQSVLLKKLLKLTDQSGSKYSEITARLCS